MKKTIINTFILIAIIIFLGISIEQAQSADKKIAETIKTDQEKEKDEKEEKLPDWMDVPKHKYSGIKYRSPFASSGSGSASTKKSSNGNQASKKIENPSALLVTGVFSGKDGKYALLSGANEYFIVKQGRVYNEDYKEIPAVAAIIKEDKIILITSGNKMYELTIPQ